MGKNSLVRSQIQTQSFQISLKFRDSNLDLQTDSSVLNTPRYKASGSKLANSLPIIAALQLSSRNWTVSNLLPLYSCFSTLIFTVAGSNPPTNNFRHPRLEYSYREFQLWGIQAMVYYGRRSAVNLLNFNYLSLHYI